MRKRIEGIGCYLSCMMLFNLIYALSILSESENCKKGIVLISNPVSITFCISIGLSIIGVIATLWIVNLDDTEKSTVTTGKSFEVVTICDKTAENYLTNFSVIVLTGIALPAQPDWVMLCVYIIIEMSIGIVYVKKNLFFMNPILTLLGYNVYECTGRDEVTKKMFDGIVIFMTQKRIIKERQVLKIKNINSKIIWLKE